MNGRTQLATGSWADRRAVADGLAIHPGDFWLGRSDTDDAIPLGHSDDRHICLTCGTRGGKGISFIVPNLVSWPGSLLVVDPKGENATLAAIRRGDGGPTVTGLHQRTFVLDPFRVAVVPDDYRACFNPLDALDPNSESFSIAAGEIANAIVVQRPEAKDTFFDDTARDMVKALIMHVCTWSDFAPEERNLLTVRRLLMRGNWKEIEKLKQQGMKTIASSQALLWFALIDNPAAGGLVGDAGHGFCDLFEHSAETYQSVLQTARTNTTFIEDATMARVLATSDFSLAELKTDAKGISVFLCLPDDYMETHHRWLRLMIGLTISEMRRIPGQPAAGYRTLMVLDEFAGLDRLRIIEKAVAQIAGYGITMFFVLQTLEQLKSVYPTLWETFLANCGTKIFFAINDNFTREYLTKLVGETEIVRITRTITLTTGETLTEGDTVTVGNSLSFGQTSGFATTKSRGWNTGTTHATAKGTSTNNSSSRAGGRSGGTNSSSTSGSNEGSSVHWGSSCGHGPGGASFSSNSGGARQTGWSRSTSNGVSEGWSDSVTRGLTEGSSATHTAGSSRGFVETVAEALNEAMSRTQGSSYSEARSISRAVSRSTALGATETLHVRPLLQANEINTLLRRIDDPAHPVYPGLALVLLDGELPCMIRRAAYFDDPCFVRYFSPHPDHDTRNERALDVAVDADRRARLARDGCTVMAQWFILPQTRVLRGQQIGMLVAQWKNGEEKTPLVAANDGMVWGLSEGWKPAAADQSIGYRLITTPRRPAPDFTIDGKLVWVGEMMKDVKKVVSTGFDILFYIFIFLMLGLVAFMAACAGLINALSSSH